MVKILNRVINFFDIIAATHNYSLKYEYIWSGDLPMDVQQGPLPGRVTGEYDNVSQQVLTTALNWKF
jgi:hypothetical protein